MKKIFFSLLFFLNLKSSQEIQFQLPLKSELQSLFIKNGYSFFAQETPIESLFIIKIAPTLAVDTKVFTELFTKSPNSYLGACEEIFFPFDNVEIQESGQRTFFVHKIKLLLPYLKREKNHLFFDIPRNSITNIFNRSMINICGELGGKTLSLYTIQTILSSNFAPYNVINFFKRMKPITKEEEHSILSKIIESSIPKVKAYL